MNGAQAQVVAAPPAPAANGAAKPKKRKQKSKRKASAEPPVDGKAVHVGKAINRTANDNKPADQFVYVLGPEEKAVHDYLRGVFDPEQHVARVPVTRGGFELFTQTWQTRETGTVVAGADGTAVLGVCAANWVAAGNQRGVPEGPTQVLGYTNMGSATVRSVNSATNYTARMPQMGSGIGASADWGRNILKVPTDYAMTNFTRIRLTAMKLKVRTDTSPFSASGEVMLVGTANPAGGALGGSLNDAAYGATWDDIENTNSNVLTRATKQIPGWASDDVFSIVAIPNESQALEMVEVPANGWSSDAAGAAVPRFHLGLFGRNMVPAQQLQYEIIYNWETELARTNNADMRLSGPVRIPDHVMDTSLAKSRPYAAASDTKNIHMLPWVETLADHYPNSLNALDRHPNKPAALRPAKGGGQLVLYKKPESSFLGSVVSGAKSLLKGVAHSGALSKVPYIGTPLQAAANWVSSLFD